MMELLNSDDTRADYRNLKSELLREIIPTDYGVASKAIDRFADKVITLHYSAEYLKRRSADRHKETANDDN